MRLPRRWFCAALVDDVALAERARALLDDRPSQTFDHHYYRSLTERYGADLAMAVLYRAIECQNEGFIRTFHRLLAEPFHAKSQAHLLIVPGLFYRERPEVGGDGALLAQIASRCGLTAEIVAIASRGSVSHNARVLGKAVQQCGQQPLWLVSLSKGSAEARLYLQQNASNLPAHLSGWINVSGIPCGTPWADLRLNHPLKRVLMRALCRISGFSYRAVDEMRGQHEYWQQPLRLPSRLQLVHVLALPLLCHLSQPMVRRYLKLRSQGPNDGMVDLLASAALPGHLLPLWGCDHLLRHPDLSSMLYRLCAWIDRASQASARPTHPAPTMAATEPRRSLSK